MVTGIPKHPLFGNAVNGIDKTARLRRRGCCKGIGCSFLASSSVTTTAAPDAALAIDGNKARDRNMANDDEDKEATNVSRWIMLVVVLPRRLQGLVVVVVLVIIDEDNKDDDSDSDADPRVELFSWLDRSCCCCGLGCWIGSLFVFSSPSPIVSILARL